MTSLILDEGLTNNASRSTFKDVPWRWSQVLIGFAPLLLFALMTYFRGPYLPRSWRSWLWIPFVFLQISWFAAYPCWVARRLPTVPRLRKVLIEAMVALLFAPAFVFLMIATSLILSRFLGMRESPSPFEPIAGASESHHPIALVVMSVVAAPLAEEIFFRGMVFNFLRQRTHFLLAAMISGAVFGLMHPFGLMERLTIVICGTGLALFYQWRKTLAAPILVHSFVNAAGMAMLFYSISVAANAPVLGVKGETQENGGLLVKEIAPGLGAELAGIRAGDVITRADESSIRSLDDLALIMRSKKVGDTIPVWFQRDGRYLKVEATLKARPK